MLNVMGSSPDLIINLESVNFTSYYTTSLSYSGKVYKNRRVRVRMVLVIKVVKMRVSESNS